MYNFWTEDQIENWLSHHTKKLLMPDGSCRVVQVTNLIWEYYEEEVMKTGGYTPEEVIGFSLTEARETGRPFDEAFAVVVAHVAQVVRDRDWSDNGELGEG